MRAHCSTIYINMFIQKKGHIFIPFLMCHMCKFSSQIKMIKFIKKFKIIKYCINDWSRHWNPFTFLNGSLSSNVKRNETRKRRPSTNWLECPLTVPIKLQHDAPLKGGQICHFKSKDHIIQTCKYCLLAFFGYIVSWLESQEKVDNYVPDMQSYRGSCLSLRPIQ